MMVKFLSLSETQPLTLRNNIQALPAMPLLGQKVTLPCFLTRSGIRFPLEAERQFATKTRSADDRESKWHRVYSGRNDDIQRKKSGYRLSGLIYSQKAIFYL